MTDWPGAGRGLACAAALLSAPAAAQPLPPMMAASVTFQPQPQLADVVIYLEAFAGMAQESWFIAGPCRTAIRHARVRVSPFASGADLRVHLTPFALSADRVICLRNPEAMPQLFRKAMPPPSAP